jgi:hypothetical protein
VKVAALLEAYEDITRTEWLKLQQEFIEHLSDDWVVDLEEQGLVFRHEEGTNARIDDAHFPVIDSGPQTVSAFIAEIKAHLASEKIEHTKITCKPSKGEPIFTIWFPTVNDAVKAMFNLHNYDMYEMLKYPTEVEGLATYIQEDIVIL